MHKNRHLNSNYPYKPDFFSYIFYTHSTSYIFKTNFSNPPPFCTHFNNKVNHPHTAQLPSNPIQDSINTSTRPILVFVKGQPSTGNAVPPLRASHGDPSRADIAPSPPEYPELVRRSRLVPPVWPIPSKPPSRIVYALFQLFLSRLSRSFHGWRFNGVLNIYGFDSVFFAQLVGFFFGESFVVFESFIFPRSLNLK